jgi:hypothetical protein
MAATTTANIVDALERNYQPKKLISLALQNCPLTTFFPKSTDGSGDKCQMRFYTNEAGGFGSNMTNAKARQLSPGFKSGTADWKIGNSYWSVNNATAKRLQGSSGLVDLLQEGIQSTMRRHGTEIETMLFGAGNGKLGRRASASTNVITLTNAGEAFNFQIGQEVVADDTVDGSSLRVGSTTVTAVDYSNNKITLASAAGITSFADNDYLFLKDFEGAFGTGGSPAGLQAIIPSTAPSASGDYLTGLDRSLQPDLLAGFRYSGISGDTITEQLIKFLQHGSKFEGVQDTMFVSTDTLTQLILESKSQGLYDPMTMGSKEYNVSFTGVKFLGPNGPVGVFGSPKCPDTLAWALERKSWNLQSVAEPLIAVATRTGKYIDVEVEDETAAKWRSQFQLLCKWPSHNGCATLSK